MGKKSFLLKNAGYSKRTKKQNGHNSAYTQPTHHFWEHFFLQPQLYLIIKFSSQYGKHHFN